MALQRGIRSSQSVKYEETELQILPMCRVFCVWFFQIEAQSKDHLWYLRKICRDCRKSVSIVNQIYQTVNYTHMCIQRMAAQCRAITLCGIWLLYFLHKQILQQTCQVFKVLPQKWTQCSYSLTNCFKS